MVYQCAGINLLAGQWRPAWLPSAILVISWTALSGDLLTALLPDLRSYTMAMYRIEFHDCCCVLSVVMVHANYDNSRLQGHRGTQDGIDTSGTTEVP
jgi:hypothetical protein